MKRQLCTSWFARTGVGAMVIVGVAAALVLTLMPDTAEDERVSFPNIVAEVRPSIVAIGTFDERGTPPARYYGTGFIAGNGNTVVTNDHVVDAIETDGRIDQLTIFFPDQRANQGRRAKLLDTDARHDVAVLRFEGSAEKPLKLSNRSSVPQGTDVAAVGYPIGTVLGVVPAVHKGIISAQVPAVLPVQRGTKLTPELVRAMRDPYDIYQLDMVIYPGNSGSPLIDANTGEVVGIVNKTLGSRTREHLISSPTGIGYAVPVVWVKRLLATTDSLD